MGTIACQQPLFPHLTPLNPSYHMTLVSEMSGPLPSSTHPLASFVAPSTTAMPLPSASLELSYASFSQQLTLDSLVGVVAKLLRNMVAMQISIVAMQTTMAGLV